MILVCLGMEKGCYFFLTVQLYIIIYYLLPLHALLYILSYDPAYITILTRINNKTISLFFFKDFHQTYSIFLMPGTITKNGA